jgi:hypothetical protein
MSHRSEDQTFIDMIRTMKRRIEALEKQMASSKVNDIRIGDIVVSTETETNRIVMRNLANDTQKYLGDPDDVVFSYSGTLVYDPEDEGINSPPHVMDRNSVISEIVLSMNNATLDDISVYVISNNTTHFFTATLPVGQTVHVTPCNIPVAKNTRVFVQLQDLGAADGNAHDLSVFLRFGAQTTAARADTEL